MKKIFLAIAIAAFGLTDICARNLQFLHLHQVLFEETERPGKRPRSLTGILIQAGYSDGRLQLFFEPLNRGMAVYEIADEYGNLCAAGTIDTSYENTECINIDGYPSVRYVITLRLEDGCVYEGIMMVEQL